MLISCVVRFIEWIFNRLYDFYPDGKEDDLLNMMKTLKATGDSWEAIFAPEVRVLPLLRVVLGTRCREIGLTPHRLQNFPTTATDGMNSPISDIAWHGVNVAEALKAFPASYRFTKNQSGTPNLI